MSEKTNISYRAATGNKRIEAALTREINAPAQKILPLACPVEELRWIPNWNYQMIYSKSGVNETNCIFTEEISGPHFLEKPLTTTWVTNVLDPDNNRILFHLNFDGQAVIRFYFTIREVGKAVSSCSWQMMFTALDEEANAMTDESIQTKLELMMTFLAEALKHYCETGEMLK